MSKQILCKNCTQIVINDKDTCNYENRGKEPTYCHYWNHDKDSWQDDIRYNHVKDCEHFKKVETSKDKFLSFVKAKDAEIVGSFKNEFGEEYIVYCFFHVPYKYFATGDELDWEMGWEVDEENPHIRLIREFYFNNLEEISTITKMVDTHFQENEEKWEEEWDKQHS